MSNLSAENQEKKTTGKTGRFDNIVNYEVLKVKTFYPDKGSITLTSATDPVFAKTFPIYKEAALMSQPL